jgi:hypothetical protein
MHPVRLLTLAGALLASTAALAQSTDTSLAAPPPGYAPPPARWEAPTHLIGINPLNLLWGELSLEYEQGLGHSASLLFTPSALLYPGVFTPFANGVNVLGFGLMVGLHFFPYPNGLNGFWIGPEVTGQFASVSTPDATGAGFGLTLAGALGYTFIIADHFGISLGLGAGWRKVWAGAEFVDGSSTGLIASGLAITGRFSFSWAF